MCPALRGFVSCLSPRPQYTNAAGEIMYVKGGKNGDTWRSPKTEELQIRTPGSV